MLFHKLSRWISEERLRLLVLLVLVFGPLGACGFYAALNSSLALDDAVANLQSVNLTPEVLHAACEEARGTFEEYDVTRPQACIQHLEANSIHVVEIDNSGYGVFFDAGAAKTSDSLKVGVVVDHSVLDVRGSVSIRAHVGSVQNWNDVKTGVGAPDVRMIRTNPLELAIIRPILAGATYEVAVLKESEDLLARWLFETLEEDFARASHLSSSGIDRDSEKGQLVFRLVKSLALRNHTLSAEGSTTTENTLRSSEDLMPLDESLRAAGRWNGAWQFAMVALGVAAITLLVLQALVALRTDGSAFPPSVRQRGVVQTLERVIMGVAFCGTIVGIMKGLTHMMAATGAGTAALLAKSAMSSSFEFAYATTLVGLLLSLGLAPLDYVVSRLVARPAILRHRSKVAALQGFRVARRRFALAFSRLSRLGISLKERMSQRSQLKMDAVAAIGIALIIVLIRIVAS